MVGKYRKQSSIKELNRLEKLELQTNILIVTTLVQTKKIERELVYLLFNPNTTNIT